MLNFPWPPAWLLDQFKDTREMRDLLAQEAMAQWAFWMLIVTAITTGITAVSIFFLYRTYRQTQLALEQARETNAHAKETAFIENRPWILVNGPTFECIVTETTDDEISLAVIGKFRVVNTGRMPATGLHYDIVLSQDQAEIDKQRVTPPEGGKGWIILPPGIDNEFTITNVHYTLKRGADKPDNRLINVLVRVAYGDLNEPSRVLLSVGHGFLAETAPGGAASFQAITWEKVRAHPLDQTAVYAYSIKLMV